MLLHRLSFGSGALGRERVNFAVLLSWRPFRAADEAYRSGLHSIDAGRS